jgi:acetyl-CoA carboxylase biotin carboxyl carrier protein
MKAQEIQDLIDFIAKSGLSEVNIETDSFKINVKRNQAPIMMEAAPVAVPIQQIPQTTATTPTNTPSDDTAEKPSTTSNAKLVEIKSPMIGTFYRSANPDSPSFVNIGDDVKSGQAVCIIEAMKLFNEIESEVSGKIVKVLVDNATPVEYDQPLFLVELN